MVAAVRDARHEEAGAIADLLSRAAFGPTVSRLVAFPRTSPHGDVLVAENGDGAAAGAVCCVSFGATGWIGALGVAPEARRHGLGRALTEAAIARLHERGAGTVLLFATDMGRPLYERLGFVIEGAATAWRGTAGAIPTGVQVRRLREDDRAAVSELDRAATGEDRSQPARRAAPARRRRRGPLGHARRLGGQGALWRRHRHLRRRRRGRRRADGRGRERPRPRDARRSPTPTPPPWPTCAAGASAPPTPASACASGRRWPGGRSVSSGSSTSSGGRGAGASVPQPDPRPQGQGRGPLRVPRGAGSSPARMSAYEHS